MNRVADRVLPNRRRRVLLAAAAVLLLAAAWLVHTFALREMVRQSVPWLAGVAGYELTIGRAQAGLFQPVVLTEVTVKDGAGTDLGIAEATWEWAGFARLGLSPYTWIGRLELREVAGELSVAPPVVEAKSAAAAGAPVARLRPLWPSVLELVSSDLKISGRGWSLDLRGCGLLLSEQQTGNLRIGEAVVRVGPRERGFGDLQAVTAWRDGVAYFADLKLGESVMVDALAVDLAGWPALKLEARACGGYVYADVTGDGGGETKAAVNALNLSLPEAAAFAGLQGEMEGTIDLAKLTFNGDPQQPLSGQISLRLEAKNFAWRKNAVEELNVGLSVAGRRVRLTECHLRQKSNLVKLRGMITVPAEAAAWRTAPFEFDADADVGDLRALAGLFGEPWNGLSGGLRVEGRGTGRASDGQGWLKVRGWDLRARGVPSSSLQADFRLEGRDLKLTNLDAQSGSDFLRGGGQVALDEAFSYQGRLELRVREVARYLEPLGRFAPDWAREGGVLLFWDGDGAAGSHSGVTTLELVRFTGDLNPVPLNGKFSGSYSPGNIYLSRFLLDRGPLSLSSSLYFGAKGLSVQDLQLFGGRSRLLRGELFLPLSLEAVLARRPWEQTVMTDRDVYAFLRSDNLDLAAFVGLFGQETTLRGKADLRLDASGPWENAVIDGLLTIGGFGAAFPSWRIPEARAHVALQVKDRQASVGAHLQPEGAGAVTLRATLPLIGKTADGGWTLLDRGQPWSAQLEIPPTNLAAFAPQLGGMTLVRGLVRGKLTADQTPAEPRIEGALEVQDGRVAFPEGWTPVDQVEGKAVFSGTKVVLKETRARMGEGTLGVAGSVDFADRRDPVWEILVRGEALLLYADEYFRVMAAPDLAARGNKETGEVKGSIDLGGTAVTGGLVVTPQLGGIETAAMASPFRMTLSPFAGWTLDLKMSAADRLPVGPDGTEGSLAPDLFLRGTAGEPVLSGTVQVEGLTVAFPSRAKMTARGKVHFTSAQPWVPVLDLVGAGEAGAYDFRAGAFGPFDRRALLLSSVPPLAAEQIVLLLTTGVNPVPAAAAEMAPLTPAAKMQAEPSWLDLDKIRGLFGWGTENTAEDGSGMEWSLGEEAVGFAWGWR